MFSLNKSTIFIFIVLFLTNFISMLYSISMAKDVFVVSDELKTMYFDENKVKYNVSKNGNKNFDVWLKIQYTQEGKKDFINNTLPNDSEIKNKFKNFDYSLIHIKYFADTAKKELYQMTIEYLSYDSNGQIIETFKDNDPQWEQIGYVDEQNSILFNKLIAFIEGHKETEQIITQAQTQPQISPQTTQIRDRKSQEQRSEEKSYAQGIINGLVFAIALSLYYGVKKFFKRKNKESVKPPPVITIQQNTPNINSTNVTSQSPTLSSEELGQKYERHVGWAYEQKGFKVFYSGMVYGYKDAGRDLICTKGDVTIIVQCKYWASNKVIHPKYINELFGTTVNYYYETINQQGSLEDYNNYRK
jgi:hypothetical protein